MAEFKPFEVIMLMEYGGAVVDGDATKICLNAKPIAKLVRCEECRWACLAPQRKTATCMKNRLPFTHEYDFFCKDGERKEQSDG